MRTKDTIDSRRGGVGRTAAWRGVVAATLVAFAGCDVDRLLDVPDPDVIIPDVLEDETALPTLRAHALSEFSVMYGANPGLTQPAEGFILMTGMLADEFIHTGTFDTREIIDRRIVIETNPHVQGLFLRIQRARVSAERAEGYFARFGANTAAHAEMQNLAGYSYSFLAEGFCSGIPISDQLADGTIDYGAPETTTQVFNRALARFDEALATATAAGSVQQQNLARLGRGRALLGLGQYQAAAQAVAQVPTNFEYVLFHSETTARQNNGVWFFNNNQGRWSIPDREGTNGLPYRSRGNVAGDIRDPRLPTERIGLAWRTALQPNEHWGQLKYPLRASPMTLAVGVEARLIEAEAALRQGAAGIAQFVAIHSALRSGAGLPALEVAAITALTQRQREDLHFAERAYWLWLTGRRLPDLRRMMWDYGRAQNEIFPIGNHYRAGTAYGTDTNFPVPFDEQNNPLFDGCLTRNDAAGRG